MDMRKKDSFPLIISANLHIILNLTLVIKRRLNVCSTFVRVCASIGPVPARCWHVWRSVYGVTNEHLEQYWMEVEWMFPGNFLIKQNQGVGARPRCSHNISSCSCNIAGFTAIWKFSKLWIKPWSVFIKSRPGDFWQLFPMCISLQCTRSNAVSNRSRKLRIFAHNIS